MTSMTEYLTLEDLLALIGRSRRRAGAPTSACWNRRRTDRLPRQARRLRATIEKKAAALLDSLVRDRPLADGNKRLDGSPHSFSWTSTAAGSRSPTTRPTNW